MQMRWIGQLVVLKRFNDVIYQVKVNEKEMRIIPYDLQKLCEAQDMARWVGIAREKLVKKQ